jgi:hypothetical protein
MIVLWMLYSTLIGVLLWVSARALEEVLRIVGWASRWVWLGGLGMMVALSAAGWATRYSGTEDARDRGRLDVLPGEAAVPNGFAAPALVEIEWATALTFAGAGREKGMNRLLGGAATAIGSERLRELDGMMVGLWTSVSGLLILLIVATVRRSRRQRAGWPLKDLDGGAVRVAPTTGPAVIGIARPEVIVPEWLAARGGEELRLAVEHEREHIRAGDPRVLLAGVLLVAVAPWNPVGWWMLSRLRLAVEIDCDRRVLRRGAEPGEYGSLLLDIAGHRFPNRRPSGAVALIGTRSHLEQRLLTLVAPRIRHPVRRGMVLCALASVASFAACQTRFVGPAGVAFPGPGAEQAEGVPIETTIRSPDMPMEEPADPADSAEVVGTTALPATAPLSASRITRGATPDPAVRLVAPSAVPGRESLSVTGRAQLLAGSATRDRSSGSDTIPRLNVFRGNVPLIIVDGVIVGPLIVIDGVIIGPGATDSIPDREDIESIEVIRGGAARALFGESAAAGVVHVRTRGAPEPPMAPPAPVRPPAGTPIPAPEAPSVPDARPPPAPGPESAAPPVAPRRPGSPPAPEAPPGAAAPLSAAPPS